MDDVRLLVALLALARKFGEVNTVHLYEGGIISIESDGFRLTFTRKGVTNGRTQDVCQNDHRFRHLS